LGCDTGCLSPALVAPNLAERLPLVFLKRGADQPDEYEQSATDHKPVWEIQYML
jgi:hypothetical protein